MHCCELTRARRNMRVRMGIKVKIHLQSAEMQHVLFAPCLNAPHQFVLVLRDHHTAAIVIRYCVLKCLELHVAGSMVR